jgi:anti-anti-sigma regulatory factor
MVTRNYDIHSADELLLLADDENCKYLNLRFDDVDILTGAALGTLVRVHQKLQAKGGKLQLHNVGSFTYEVFCATGLTKVLNITRAESRPHGVSTNPGGKVGLTDESGEVTS